jgi:hypothetical protein
MAEEDQHERLPDPDKKFFKRVLKAFDKIEEGPAIGTYPPDIFRTPHKDQAQMVIDKSNTIDNIVEFMVETNRKFLVEYLEDHDNYTHHKLERNCSIQDLDSFCMVWRGKNKKERVRQLNEFFEEHPLLRSTNPNIIRQRLTNYFLLHLERVPDEEVIASGTITELIEHRTGFQITQKEPTSPLDFD